MSRDLCGVAEIADEFGVSKQLASEWTKATTFPKPVATLASGRIWAGHRVVGWVAKYRPERMPVPPRGESR